MLQPVILFNASSGSDLLTSGAGPLTAVAGLAAAHTSGVGSTTITLTDSPDLTNVPDDGSAVVRLVTSSGRQYSRIVGRDNSLKTLIVEDSFNIASGSAVDYAIGGKRSTVDHANSRVLLLTDIKAGWTAELETNQTLTSALASSANGDLTSGPISFRGANGHIVLTQTANTRHFSSTGVAVPTRWRFSRIHFQNSYSGTKTVAYAIDSNSGIIFVDNCIFGDVTNTLNRGLNRGGNGPQFVVTNCEFKYCNQFGINGLVSETIINNCYIHHCGIGINSTGSTNAPVVIQDNIIAYNTDTGVRLQFGGTLRMLQVIVRNVIAHNSGDGIDISAVEWDRYFIRSNQITHNGGYGIRAATNQTTWQHMIDYNNYYQNTAGALLNLNAGQNDLAINPQYANAAGGDYSAGPVFRSAGYPGANRFHGGNQTTTRLHNDIGIQQAPSDGMGAHNLHLGMEVACG